MRMCAAVGGELLDPVPQLLRQRRGGEEPSRSRLKNARAAASSRSRRGSSPAYPAGTLK
jgi:hypothetical protein